MRDVVLNWAETLDETLDENPEVISPSTIKIQKMEFGIYGDTNFCGRGLVGFREQRKDQIVRTWI